MNWLQNIFPLKKVPAAEPNEQVMGAFSTQQTQLLEPCEECTAPIAESHEPLSYGQIQHLVPLRHLDIQAISVLACKTLTYAEQSVIFVYGQSACSVYYLLAGIVSVLPKTGENYQITAGSTRAHLPINSGQCIGATVVANTEVKVLVVDADLTQLWTAKSKGEMDFVELMDLSLPESLDNIPFLHRFTEAYRENTLNLPALPDMALRLKEAMIHGLHAQEVIDLIQSDSELANKLIQLANSPLYAPINPITSCQEVVSCLGLPATVNLVTCISLKQLFVCHDKEIMAAMQNLWRRSLYVACLSFVLAEEVGDINSDDALLAGLLSDVGVIPLLRFADQYTDMQAEITQLEEAVAYIRAPVGTLMLNSLGFGFADDLISIQLHSENWHYDSGGELSLTDIVILAKLHSYFGSLKAHQLPFINTLPAYAKLKNGKLTPDFSLNVLRQANQRIKAAINVLA